MQKVDNYEIWESLEKNMVHLSLSCFGLYCVFNLPKILIGSSSINNSIVYFIFQFFKTTNLAIQYILMTCWIVNHVQT